uniref:Uncharacterized protein n=1 Tax=Onchocerca volvulus TaxID=6282 RepID=A0A8R1TTF1_ONCVO
MNLMTIQNENDIVVIGLAETSKAKLPATGIRESIEDLKEFTGKEFAKAFDNKNRMSQYVIDASSDNNKNQFNKMEELRLCYTPCSCNQYKLALKCITGRMKTINDWNDDNVDSKYLSEKGSVLLVERKPSMTGTMIM